MDLRELEYFQSVGKLKSFTGAANKLCITQPSITVAIKKLEEELGVSLLERSKKKVALTIEGEIFLQRVDNILNDLNNAILEMSDYKNLNKEVINLGMPPMIGMPLLPKIFDTYKKNNSKTDVILHEFGSLDIVDLLEKEEVDIGLIALNNSSELLETEKIGVEEIFVCLPLNHSLKDLPSIPFKSLKNEHLIFSEGGNNIRKMVLEECEKNGFKPCEVYNSKLFENMKNLVSNGVGITFFINPTAMNSHNIIWRSLDPPLCIEVGIAWKKNKFLTKSQRELINFMKISYV